MHAGTLLLKMAQESEMQWRAVSELAALCYLHAFQVNCFKQLSVQIIYMVCTYWKWWGRNLNQSLFLHTFSFPGWYIDMYCLCI